MKNRIMRMVVGLMAVVTVGSAARAGVEIRIAPEAPAQQRLAAKEVARYLYLRTGSMPEQIGQDGRIVIATKESALVADATVRAAASELKPQQYVIKTTASDGKKIWWIVGGDDVGALYGAYRFLEHLGVRFYLHQDVVPDQKLALLPDVDDVGKPIFELRGLNPWGAHVEGIDLWNADEYKAVLAQMSRMRMNVMMIHSYPEEPGIEPAVWVGLPQDVGSDGKVKSSPTASYWNSQRSLWGHKPRLTGDYRFGGSRLFEGDKWGADVMGGCFPMPKTSEDRNAVFDRAGEMFRDAFSFARALGVKTAMGTECGISPSKVGQVAKAGEKLSLAKHGPPIMVSREIRERLKQLGKDPADPAVIRELYEGMFTRITRTHPLDYYILCTPEQYYWKPFTREMFNVAVEEWKLALEAWEKVKPPFGLVAWGWQLGPDFDRAAFDQVLPKHVAISEMSRAYNAPVDEAFGRVSGRPKWAVPWIEEDAPILTPQLWAGRVRKDAADALAYGCTGLLTLHWRTLINEAAATAVAQAGWDQRGWNPEFGKEHPAPPPSTYQAATTTSAAPPNWKPTMIFNHGCSKPGSLKYQPRGLPVSDLYADWAQANFGPEASKQAAAIFSALDGRIPLPSMWAGHAGAGAGGIKPDERPWEFVKTEYEFVERLEALQPLVKGAANQERFDFWLNQFRYTRATARAACVYGRLGQVMKDVKTEKDSARQKTIAAEKALPVLKELVSAVGDAYQLLLSTVTDIGGIQTVLNWENHNQLLGIEETGKELSAILNAPLPPEAIPSAEYKGEPRLIVPTKRTVLEKGEPLRLKVIVLDNQPAAAAVLRWRPLGGGEYRSVPLKHLARGVYKVELPAGPADFEYHIEAKIAGGKTLLWPVTAPERNQTVVVWEK